MLLFCLRNGFEREKSNMHIYWLWKTKKKFLNHLFFTMIYFMLQKALTLFNWVFTPKLSTPVCCFVVVNCILGETFYFYIVLSTDIDCQKINRHRDFKYCKLKIGSHDKKKSVMLYVNNNDADQLGHVNHPYCCLQFWKFFIFFVISVIFFQN